jgi:putative sigma-54 modulation protein
MQPEEAVMQMELLDKDFFIFSNIGSGQINVIYRRKDGNVGLIEPAP